MRRVVVGEYGGPEVLVLEEAAVPTPGPGELLVEVAATGVSLAVVRRTHGDGRGGGDPLPFAPGGEVVGRVTAVGDDVDGWQPGRRAAGLVLDAAYAEFAVLRTALATPVPDRVHDGAAVSLVRGGQVALGVLRASALRTGERVLVTAAASGVGHLAVQLARVLGAGTVVAAVGDTVGKRDFLTGLGADRVVAYDSLPEEWGGPFDVVLYGTGDTVQTSALELLAPLGRLVSYNAHGAPVDVNLLRLHARTVIGFAMAPLVAARPEVYREHREELWRRHLAGEVRPHVHAVLPLERAADAHRIIEDRANLGRVLLVPQGADAVR